MISENDNTSPPLNLAELANLKELIAARSDRDLAPAENERLQEILATSRDARSIYIAHMQLDAVLDWTIRGSQSVDGIVERSRHPVSLLRELGRLEEPGRQWLARKRMFSYLAVAASITLLAGSIAWFWLPAAHNMRHPGGVKEVSAVAKLVQISPDCSWFIENRRGSDPTIHIGDKVRLTRGQVRMDFACGASVTMRSPAALEVISPMRTRAVLGTLKAHVGKGAEGFTVETPRTTVVDLGTDFGVDVSRHGSTDVVVFNGAVDLHSEGISGLSALQRLNAGEGVRVSGEGTASRIVSILDSQFSMRAARRTRDRTPVISEVRDNVRRGESWKYYEIVHGGMREDAKAFVDREHEWNGVTASGMPGYLLGADYVKTFNDDKINREVEIRLNVARPAILYVLLDKRSPVPDWLRDRFFNTGDEIGLDGGKYTRFGERKSIAVGAGKSIDDVFSIWRLDVARAETVTLGAIQPGGETHNMYGVVAVPMEIRSGHDDFAGSAEHPAKKSSPLTSGSQGELYADGSIERPNDIDAFRFDWKGGVAEAACETNGYTTLDPVLSVYDENETLVGYGRAPRSSRNRSAVRMNLPAGTFYALVTGSDEVGEVGTYHLELKPVSGSIQPPLAPSPLFAFRAKTNGRKINLKWNKLPSSNSYIVEKSADAVSFQRIGTPVSHSFETALEAGASCIYRVRTSSGEDSASAPLLVRGAASTPSRLQAFGASPQLVVLEWRDVLGEQGYRVERSTDGGPFVTVGRAPQNACGYRDTSVEPRQRYTYRITALNAASPDAVSAPISAMSGVAGLSAVARGNDQVVLTWKPGYSRASLFIERATDGPDSFVTIGAVRGDTGEFVDQSVHVGEEPRYRVLAVEDVSDLSEMRSEQIDRVRLPESVSKDDFFALRFTGKISVPKRGKYNFFLTSDDGSRFFLDGSLVANNDERHVEQTVAGTIRLEAGLHDLEVQYFQHDGDKKLELLWAGSGIHFSEATSSNLSSVICHYYAGKWWRLPFDRSCAVSDIVRVSKPGNTGSDNSSQPNAEKVP
jgi:hypothetical protein